MRKTRPDSTIGSLEPDLKDQVDELLLAGHPYRKVQELLAESGIKLSLTSIGEYYQRQVLPARIARQNRTAAELNKIAIDGLDDATMQALRLTVFDLAASPKTDAKTLNVLMGLVLKAESLKQDDRRLKLLEQRAAQADKAQETASDSKLTEEEKMQKIRAIFGMS